MEGAYLRRRDIGGGGLQLLVILILIWILIMILLILLPHTQDIPARPSDEEKRLPRKLPAVETLHD